MAFRRYQSSGVQKLGEATALLAPKAQQQDRTMTQAAGREKDEFCQKEVQQIGREEGKEDRGGEEEVRRRVGLLHLLCKANWCLIHR